MKKYLKIYLSIISTKRKIEIGKRIERDVKWFHTILLFLFVAGSIKWAIFQVKIFNEGVDDLWIIIFNIYVGFILLLGVAGTLLIILKKSTFDKKLLHEADEISQEMEANIDKEIINKLNNGTKRSLPLGVRIEATKIYKIFTSLYVILFIFAMFFSNFIPSKGTIIYLFLTNILLSFAILLFLEKRMGTINFEFFIERNQ